MGPSERRKCAHESENGCFALLWRFGGWIDCETLHGRCMACPCSHESPKTVRCLISQVRLRYCPSVLCLDAEAPPWGFGLFVLSAWTSWHVFAGSSAASRCTCLSPRIGVEVLPN